MIICERRCFCLCGMTGHAQDCTFEDAKPEPVEEIAENESPGTQAVPAKVVMAKSSKTKAAKTAARGITPLETGPQADDGGETAAAEVTSGNIGGAEKAAGLRGRALRYKIRGGAPRRSTSSGSTGAARKKNCGLAARKRWTWSRTGSGFI